MPSLGTRGSIKLLHRGRREAPREDDYYTERPPLDEAPEPQPEREEPKLADPGVRDLTKRDFLAVIRRAFKKFNGDHMTSIAAALAYYAFMAIPAALLVAVGVFGLFAGPNAITTVIDKLKGMLTGQATSLLEGSIKNLKQHRAISVDVLV